MTQSTSQIRTSPVTMLYTFGYLHITTLCRASRVCKEWHRLIQMPFLWKGIDMSKHFSLMRFDEQFWKSNIDCVKLKLDPSGVPAFAQTKTSVLALLKLSHQVEGDKGITDLTLPKGLSIKTLMKIAKLYLPDIPVFYTITEAFSRENGVPADFLKEHGDKELKATTRIFITNGILFGSRYNFSISRYEKPSVLHVATLILLVRISSPPSGTYLFGTSPITYTCCTETVGKHQRVCVIGAFNPRGVDIFPLYQIWQKDCGVAGIRPVITEKHSSFRTSEDTPES